jgi:hypothetical protein
VPVRVIILPVSSNVILRTEAVKFWCRIAAMAIKNQKAVGTNYMVPGPLIKVLDKVES